MKSKIGTLKLTHKRIIVNQAISDAKILYYSARTNNFLKGFVIKSNYDTSNSKSFDILTKKYNWLLWFNYWIKQNKVKRFTANKDLLFWQSTGEPDE